MFRTLLCTVALTIALTAAHAEAGGFKFSIGGGNKGHNNHHHNNHHNNHHFNNHHNNYHHNHYPKVYHAPVVKKCYYQVCFYHASWGYKKHERFTCLHDAQAFAHQLQHNGYYTSISKTCTPYASGHIIYNHGHGHIHNSWMP